MRKKPEKKKEKGEVEWPTLKTFSHALVRGICGVIPGTKRSGLESTNPDVFVIFPERQFVCLRCGTVKGTPAPVSQEDMKSLDFAMRLKQFLIEEGKAHMKCEKEKK